MTTAIAERPTDALAVTGDQLDLIRRTIAKDATPDELKLYLYDCQRQGVHPLDKLLYFTKRKGKYTPITSIDFMRIRAADSGEMAGSDDPVFGDANVMGHSDASTVTVYRLTQGQRFAYTATARWAEYYPGDGDVGFMWRKMPHTMLGKCAEALALRKGFPRQLAGLYAREEMDQADEPKAGYVVEAPAARTAAILPAVTDDREKSSAPNDGDIGHPHPDAMLPEGYVYIRRVDVTDTKNKNVRKALVSVSTGETYNTINPKLAALCESLAQNATPVRIKGKETRFGLDLVSVHAEPSHADLDAEIARADMARAAGEIA